jgi:soluble lytic murein transglycosylase
VFAAYASLLWPVTVTAANAPEGQRALFLEAEQALDRGQVAEARQKAETLAGYPLQVYLLGRVLSRDPLDEPAMRAFLDRHGASRHSAPVRKKWLDLTAAANRWPDFLKYAKDGGDARGQCLRLWALLQTGQATAARAGAARLWAEGEAAPPECERVFAEWRASPDYRPEHFWQRFGAALAGNRVELAASLLNLAPQRADAEAWLRLHKDPEQAGQCGALNPGNPLAGRIFAHSVDRLAAKQPERAVILWNLRRDGFRIDAAEQARLDRRLALALAAQRRPEAPAYLAALPDAEADGASRAWRVRAALANRDWPAAFAALNRLDAAESRDDAWVYWRARVLEELGQPAAARGLLGALADQRDFYGFLAADRLQQDYGLSFPAPSGSPASLKTLAQSPPFLAVAEFLAVRRPGEAKKEWAEAVDKLAREQLPLAAQLAADWGWHRQAILALGKAGQKDELGLRFPLAYTEAVAGASARTELDPALIYGVIRRESAFDPEARSPVGALGLMQLMPGTGQDMARRLKEAWTSEHNLLDPVRNVRFGSTYLKGLLDRFGQHPALAAAGYNAGPSRAERWQPKSGPFPADLWIETIPFNETRAYVMAVLSYATIYRAQLGRPNARIGELLRDIPAAGKPEEPPGEPVPLPACG